jgi:hypothetical protein
LQSPFPRQQHINLARPTRLDAGIFLTSFAVLLLELLLTRIFSVTLYYHLSFAVVSLAMLGFGASGLAASVFAARVSRARLSGYLSVSSLLLAVCGVLSVGVSLRVPVSLYATRGNLLRLGVIYLASTVPFFLGGLVVALILSSRAKESNRLYFFDLAGAAAACLLFIPLTNRLGAPTAVLAACVVASVAACVFAWRESRVARGAAIALACVLLACAAANLKWDFYDVRFVKGRAQRPMLALKWNSFSRVEVEAPAGDMWTPIEPRARGLSKRLDPDFRIPEIYLRYDGSAATQITRFDGDLTRLAHLRYDVSSAAYQMRPYPKVLVLGAGGGRDILTALVMGDRDVTGVEINPITIELMRTQFRDFSGGLYAGYPGVRVVHEEGRNFLRRETQSYDLIQASLVDTWAASAAGAYALSENSLYTVEAFGDYLEHLTPDGVVSFTRWFPDPPAEPLRVVSLAAAALRRAGASDPSRHIFVVRTNVARGEPVLSTILVKRSPFTTDELARLRAWAGEMDFAVPYSPDDATATTTTTQGMTPQTPTATTDADEFHQLLGEQGARFVKDYPYDISAVYDDRPFFFDRVPVAAWLARRAGLGRPNEVAVSLTLGGQSLVALLLVSALCTVLFVLTPFAPARLLKIVGGETAASVDAASARGARARTFVWALYFACLGVGYIATEIVMIQRFNLFLGYPVYSISVVLFTLLLASGVGSLSAGGRALDGKLSRLFLALVAALVLYAAALPRLLNVATGLSTPAKILLAATVLAPLGLLMGMPFPTALRLADRESKRLVPLAWAANGTASVFGSALTMLVSMTYGLTASLAVAATVYAAALCLLWRLAASANSNAVRGRLS